MPETEKPKTTPAAPSKEGAVSLPGAAIKTPMPGGFGGATAYVPSPAEVQEQKRIYEEVEARRNGDV